MKNRQRAIAVKLNWIIALAFFAADRATKLWAEASLRGVGWKDFWPGIIGLRYARNTGAAFSLFHGGNTALAVTTAIILAVVVAYYFLEKKPTFTEWLGLPLIVAGGLGNLLDRLIYGYVIDFISFEFINFAVFNVADAVVCIGAALTALGVLFGAGGYIHDLNG